MRKDAPWLKATLIQCAWAADGTLYHDLAPDHSDRRAKPCKPSVSSAVCKGSATLSSEPPGGVTRGLFLSSAA